MNFKLLRYIIHVNLKSSSTNNTIISILPDFYIDFVTSFWLVNNKGVFHISSGLFCYQQHSVTN